jgi:hypothetical protein
MVTKNDDYDENITGQLIPLLQVIIESSVHWPLLDLKVYLRRNARIALPKPKNGTLAIFIATNRL